MLKDSKALLLLTPISLLLLLFPTLIRMFVFNNTFPGTKPYFHALYNSNNPFGFLSIYINPIILCFIFTFTTTILFYVLMRNFKLDVKFSLLSSLLFVISPALLYCVIFPTPYCMLFFLTVLSLVLLQTKKLKILSVPFLVLASLFGTLETFIVIVCLISLLFYSKKLFNYIIPSIIIMVGTSLIKSFTLPNLSAESISFLVTEIVTDLGSVLGFGIFSIILCILGIFLAGRHKIKVYPAYVCFALLLIVSLLFARWIFVFVNVFVVVLSAFALDSLMKRKYDVDLIKTLTLLAVVFGLLFSSLSYMHRASFLPPDNEFVDDLNWINKNSNQDDVILSYHSYGFWISYFSEREPFSDDNNKLKVVSEEIFQGRNLEETSSELTKYSIRYILITDEMKRGLVWEREEQGLLFLLHNSDLFKLVHESDDVEIWEFRG